MRGLLEKLMEEAIGCMSAIERAALNAGEKLIAHARIQIDA
jgi:hypothetical protein